VEEGHLASRHRPSERRRNTNHSKLFADAPLTAYHRYSSVARGYCGVGCGSRTARPLRSVGAGSCSPRHDRASRGLRSVDVRSRGVREHPTGTEGPQRQPQAALVRVSARPTPGGDPAAGGRLRIGPRATNASRGGSGNREEQLGTPRYRRRRDASRCGGCGFRVPSLACRSSDKWPRKSCEARSSLTVPSIRRRICHG
jgi:hypothetical protein